MGNKQFEFKVAFIDPEEIAKRTPAKREYTTWGGIHSTTVTRALTIFHREIFAEYGWSKKDIVVLGVIPAGLSKDMLKLEDVDPIYIFNDEEAEDDD